MDRACGMHEMRNTYKCLVRNPKGKKSLGSLRCIWEDNIIMGLWEIGWEGVGPGFIWLMTRTNSKVL
jgi:hypothetical protein